MKNSSEREKMKKNIVIGTTGSIVALAQAELVKNMLSEKF